jgi:F-type H+-transporting ATPase subunit b
MESTLFFAAGGVTEITQQFGLTLANFIAQVLSFSIVAFVLHRFAYQPILVTLEERRQRIAQGLADAEKTKQELAQAQLKAQEIVGQAGAQGNQLIQEARSAAAKLLEQETQKAMATANQIIAKAHQASEAELVRMKAELRHEVGHLVVQTAAMVTGKILTLDDQKRLVEETAKVVAA